ncbi:MAG: chemotaxis protein CheW [Thiohalomonadales bacterium]
MDDDEELLQDFIIEAGEILELLNEQLVELENRPQDNELLNAVFRGFHTIKGGASFLALDALVDICHRSEDVFNILRNGERAVDAAVMDIILPVLDVLNAQFDAIKNNQECPAASSEMLSQLEGLSVPVDPSTENAPSALPSSSDESNPATQTSEKSTESPSSSEGDSGEITDEEFDNLLDVLDGVRSGTPVTQAAPVSLSQPAQKKSNNEDISEEEFDNLLDSIQDARSGKTTANVATQPPILPNTEAPATATGTAKKSEDISDEEFEDLLDQISTNKKNAAQTSSVASTKRSAGSQPIKPTVTSKDAIENTANNGQSSTVAQNKAEITPKKRENAPQAETTVRVDTKRLDDIMNMVGELVLVRNRMATLGLAKSDEELAKVVANLDVVTSDLQTAVMKTRMQPIKKVFGRFPRVVRDLARSLKKEVKLEMQGEETDLDKNLVEALADPLVHLVRNAVDHGIENPTMREGSGKSRVGTVILTAEQEGDHILLTIEDDGKGMDADVLRKAAVNKGMMDEKAAARLDDKECYALIFHPGFSTKSEISDVSGRGVGMDVVKTRITQLNGSVEIDSTLGKGCMIIIKVPLTLAIMPTLMVVLKDQIFALPLANVNEIFDLDVSKTSVVDGQLVIMIRDKALPLFYLRNWLINKDKLGPLPSEGHVVVVTMGAKKIGFVVDSLIGQEEVVIKPLGALLHGMKGLAGATITGDGRISLILDIPGLMYTYAGQR